MPPASILDEFPGSPIWSANGGCSHPSPLDSTTRRGPIAAVDGPLVEDVVAFVHQVRLSHRGAAGAGGCRSDAQKQHCRAATQCHGEAARCSPARRSQPRVRAAEPRVRAPPATSPSARVAPRRRRVRDPCELPSLSISSFLACFLAGRLFAGQFPFDSPPLVSR
jgi:hypothetical protein